MSVEKTKLDFFSKRKIDEEQVLVESILNVPDAQKILWVEATAQVETVDAMTKEASFSGQVFLNAVYLDENKKIRATEIASPFLNKLMSAGITPDSRLQLVANTLSCEYDESKSKVQCVVSVSGDVVTPQSAEFVCGGDESVCVKPDDVSAQGLIKQDSVLFTQEITYPITDKMENILRVSSKACLKEVVAGENMFTVSGDIFTVIKYIEESEEGGKIQTLNFTEPFRREIEASGLTEDGIVEAFACVRQDAYKYELDKEANRVLIEVPIFVAYRIYEMVALPRAVDVFCLTNNLATTTASIEKSNAETTEFFETKFEGSVQLDTAAPRIDKIMGFSNPNLVITGAEVDGEKIYLEGIVAFDLAYFNDELADVITVRQEIPFKISLKTEGFAGEATNIVAQIVDADVVSRRGREVLLDCKIKVQMGGKTDDVDAIISDVQFGETLPEKTHAIEIYFGKKGDDLWQIAKELKVQPEIITAQNPDLILPLEQSENIVIYNAKIR
ncbi:MAG: DUF3794 domain-containing protein [Clostridia bacterium]|nr:DUF3794 domain-containing protein [Clostridia bacterium]